MPFARRNAIPIIVALVAGISYFAFLVVVTPFLDNRQQQQGPNISTVLIVENATLPTAPTRGYEPQVIKVMIGINNTVKWINQDTIVHGIPTPDDKIVI